MWVITLYSNSNIKLFEFDTVEEAKEAFENIEGCKILSEIVYYNDYGVDLVAI
ncbi:hypothetical protein V7075_03425 [Neobacillus drentensis]|uniref:hypothetical protein n=1 Tax=Neobacillus drentensis TaxID=220684 RepID=UPI0030000A29